MSNINLLHSFFGEVLRIGTPNYLPTVDDVLRARAKSTGIMDTRFNMGKLSYAFHIFFVSTYSYYAAEYTCSMSAANDLNVKNGYTALRT